MSLTCSSVVGTWECVLFLSFRIFHYSFLALSSQYHHQCKYTPFTLCSFESTGSSLRSIVVATLIYSLFHTSQSTLFSSKICLSTCEGVRCWTDSYCYSSFTLNAYLIVAHTLAAPNLASAAAAGAGTDIALFRRFDWSKIREIGLQVLYHQCEMIPSQYLCSGEETGRTLAWPSRIQ